MYFGQDFVLHFLRALIAFLGILEALLLLGGRNDLHRLVSCQGLGDLEASPMRKPDTWFYVIVRDINLIRWCSAVDPDKLVAVHPAQTKATGRMD